ncbi:hypothetical protein CW751_11920 [Brumimicrobium salinarum]|uniref:Competence protein ComEA n=1 Tax=Brumimicrobium salinarum TaxID=2058658 RepID=A0A2I0R0I0_9FLAO|nr:helix-hairpin-helix domain-containing protein [Brumimicrobium salinarum]PKR80067.1 hypothetical protein CW751_11920 [Brumimicrobium salinarum]
MAKNQWDKEKVHFTKRARRGLFVLLILFILVAVFPRLYYNYIYTPKDYNVSYMESLRPKNEQQDTTEKYNRYQQPSTAFDPNTYLLEDWMEIGLSEKQANSILNYLKSGAVLKVKSDVKKLYVVDEELYEILEPKIDLPEALPSNTNYKEKALKAKKDNPLNLDSLNSYGEGNDPAKEMKPISINLASKQELMAISGIGKYTADEIIKMRENYGGIISPNQLLDIYRVDQERLDKITPYLIFDKSEVNKLNINTASEAQLRRHPLITRDMAKSIVFFRENHRKYEELSGLLLSPYIDREKLNALTPYLKTE